MGPIAEFLTKDHARLDDSLEKAGAKPGEVDLAPFGIFREGILRHIGMEERVLIPALAKCPEAPMKLTEKMRLDHSAIANLMMPPPTLEILSALKRIIEPHNHLEEDPGGFYETCDRLLAAQAKQLTEAMRAAPEVPLRDYSKRPEALAAAKRAVARAGFDWDEIKK